jgi:hypothetical protein
VLVRLHPIYNVFHVSVAKARGPATDWGELVQAHDERDAIQSSPADVPVIDVHSL